MHQKNNNNGATKEASVPRDPYLSDLTRDGTRRDPYYSETMNAVMDEMSGTATSRRASLYNRLPH